MTASRPSTEQFTRALAAAGDLVAAVRPDQWSDPTPCTDWTVRDLINHLVLGHVVFTASLRDQDPPDRAADYLGDDPVTAYRESARALLAAFGQPGALDRVYTSPIGPAPGVALLHLCITEQLVHGWDLATATGQPVKLPEDLAEQEFDFAHTQLGTTPRTSRFAAAQPVADGAAAIDRLAAFHGRRQPTEDERRS